MKTRSMGRRGRPPLDLSPEERLARRLAQDAAGARRYRERLRAKAAIAAAPLAQGLVERIRDLRARLAR